MTADSTILIERGSGGFSLIESKSALIRSIRIIRVPFSIQQK
jgi:hypothetical protein